MKFPTLLRCYCLCCCDDWCMQTWDLAMLKCSHCLVWLIGASSFSCLWCEKSFYQRVWNVNSWQNDEIKIKHIQVMASCCLIMCLPDLSVGPPQCPVPAAPVWPMTCPNPPPESSRPPDHPTPRHWEDKLRTRTSSPAHARCSTRAQSR